MCYCYGYGYGFNNNWMAAAWGLNMLSQALGNITNRNNNSTNTQSSRRNVSSGGMTSPSIFGSSNRVGDLLSNPTQNIGTSRSSGYDPFTNPNPSKYNDLSRFYNDNLAPLSDPMFYMDMDNSNLGSFYNGSMTGNSGLGDLNPGGLSSMDTSGLAPLGEMYQYLMSQNPVSAQPQSQAQAQTHSHQSVQSQAQPQPQAQSQTQAASTQTQQATQLQTQQSSQASGQTSRAIAMILKKKSLELTQINV